MLCLFVPIITSFGSRRCTKCIPHVDMRDQLYDGEQIDSIVLDIEFRIGQVSPNPFPI
jgi:hypothetical protein